MESKSVQCVPKLKEVERVQRCDYTFSPSAETLIGQGVYGAVYCGIYNKTQVAIKTFKTFAGFVDKQSVHICLLQSKSEICRAIGVNIADQHILYPLIQFKSGAKY